MDFPLVRTVVCVGAAGIDAPEAGAAVAPEMHGDVEAVDDGDVVVVHRVAERELGQRRRRLPGELAD